MSITNAFPPTLRHAPHAHAGRTSRSLRWPLGWRLRPATAGVALASLTVLAWASFNVAAVHGIEAGLAPADLSLLRFGVAGLVLAPVCLVLSSHSRYAEGSIATNGPSLSRTLVLALLGGPLFGMLAVAGYRYAPLAHGMVFAPAAVLAVGTLCGVLLNGERVGIRHVAGGTIALAGLVVLGGGFGSAAPTWRGDVLFVAAGSMWGLYTALMRRWRIDPLAGTLRVGTASGLLAPLAFMVAIAAGTESGLAHAEWGEIALQSVMQGLVGGVVAVGVLMGAARLLGTPTAALLPSLTPAVALLIAVPALGDMPTPEQIVGVAVVMAGLTTATLRPRPKAR